MFPDSRRTTLRARPPSRMAVLVLSALLAIAALASTGLVPYAAAQPGTRTPAGDATPESFASACVQSGGSPVETRDANGAVILSSCEYSGGGFSECDWVDRTCTYGFRVAPPSGPLDDIAVDPNDVGGVLLDDTPTPTPSGPVLTEETPTPATTAEPTEPAPSAIITVSKYACPDAIGYDETGFDAYINACGEPVEGVSFKLDGASTGNPGEQLTDANGQATWTEMEGDHYYLTEEVPSGYGTPVTFCIFTGTSAYQSYAVSGENRIEFDLAEGQAITCYWFNIAASQTTGTTGATPVSANQPTPVSRTGSRDATTAPDGPIRSATLILNTFRCEPGYDHRAHDAQPARECRDQSSVILFELAHRDGRANGTSRREGPGNETGVVTFADVDPADYRLTQVELPAGETAFILACQSDLRDFSGYPFGPFALAAADGSVDLSLLAGETLACDWYDVPAPDPALRLQVYACGTAPPTEETCEPATGQYQFVLMPVNGAGEAITIQTGDDGAAQVADVAGTYQLVEIGPPPCGMTATGTGADGNLQLGAGQEVIVQIFHCA